ncbi:MAG: hypothetical protein HGB14_11365 [Anaerolineaceae bacterium]|nr:hypothetical protein [Anaerolineaceae bacterium]
MSRVSALFDLQQTDSKIDSHKATIVNLESAIADTSAVDKARVEAGEAETALVAARSGLHELEAEAQQQEETNGKKENESGLPDNMDFTLAITAKQLVYENINVSGLSMDLKYSVDGIELKKLDLELADGKMHLEGTLRNIHTGTYPGHIYLKADDIDLQKILKSFDNFDQDDFTWENSSGKISIASHHYFRMDEGLSFIRDRNFWLGNILVHHAEFKQVEPIQNALFFIGHKAKDTMVVSELNLNLLLSKNKIYFRDLLMNNNIANLALSGEIEVDKQEMDLWTAISLTDLFFRSKSQRIAETQEGIITLDTDSKLYLRMNGEFNNHKLDLVNVKNYNQHQDDIVKEITRARDTFKETRATYDQQRLK